MKIRYYCPDCRKKSILNAIYTAEPRVCAWCGYPINPKHVQEQLDQFSRYYSLVRYYSSGYMNVFIDIAFNVWIAGCYCFAILLVITHENWKDLTRGGLAYIMILIHAFAVYGKIADRAKDLNILLDRQRNPEPDEENTTTDAPDQK